MQVDTRLDLFRALIPIGLSGVQLNWNRKLSTWLVSGIA